MSGREWTKKLLFEGSAGALGLALDLNQQAIVAATLSVLPLADVCHWWKKTHGSFS
jgi:hypothetical protein